VAIAQRTGRAVKLRGPTCELLDILVEVTYNEPKKFDINCAGGANFSEVYQARTRKVLSEISQCSLPQEVREAVSKTSRLDCQ